MQTIRKASPSTSLSQQLLVLGTDYWRRIEDFPYSGYVNCVGTFVSGTINWFAFGDLDEYAIVSLDLKKETYQNITPPDLEKDLWTLGVVRDCLCTFARSKMLLDVWIMKEYGNKESWIKLYNVPYMEDRGLCAYTKALYISDDEKLLMDFYEVGSNILKLVVYDSKNDTLKIHEIQNINRWMNPEVYIKSLISPCS
ncbi:putative F-box associated interaction domain-containing protein [Medicago truncatula]|uniref:Putative F-box associated interaction domain-containing protein n=1 Tax=Medicago truncatula TaxID=3880 RepID=A0A396IQ98_MEDTR|nr:putative F-box associated interaction domain-containing protein [Medicago truncatula]